MALLKMKKLTLVAHAENRDNILKTLQTLGAVEVAPSGGEDILRPAEPQNLSVLEAKLAEVREALETVHRYDDYKPGFLTPKPAITIEELRSVSEKLSMADEAISSIKQFSEYLNSLKTKKQRLQSRIAQLEPYAGFDAPLESVKDTVFTSSLLGSVPAESAEKYAEIKHEFADLAFFEAIGETSEDIYVWVIMHKDVYERLTGELKYIGFSEAFTKDIYGTPKDIVSDLKNECASLDNETKEQEDKARSFAQYRALLESLEDYLINEIERGQSIAKLGETSAAFVLSGWLIATDEEKVQAALLKAAPECYMEFSEPSEDDNPPTAVQNGKIVEPFEAITNMYSAPSSRGFDPNKIMSFFYFLIYGMIIGDAAYGLLLTVGAHIILKLKKPTGMFRQVVSIIRACGVSTFIWGIIFGTVFSIQGIPALLSQIDDAMLVLGMCLGLGVIHIITGLVIGMYMEIKNGNILAAIFDKLSWIFAVLGGIAWLIGGTIGTVGMFVFLTGVALIIFTSARNKPGNVIKKFFLGLGAVYGITGYLSDILSYARIFGMGLSTSVIEQVFNTIAGITMGNIIGYIFGIVILIIGHTFNIMINAMGAFVHTARLQFIEFYSKFYQGDGMLFNPLSAKTKNHRLTD